MRGRTFSIARCCLLLSASALTRAIPSQATGIGTACCNLHGVRQPVEPPTPRGTTINAQVGKGGENVDFVLSGSTSGGGGGGSQ